MRSITRPPAEFVNGEERASMQRRKKRATAAPTITRPWPMLWLGRVADYEKDSTCYEWDEFLNKLGAQNRQLGRARTVGSTSISFVTGTEMGYMLGEKYDAYNESPQKALRLQRRVAEGIRHFMHESGRDAQDESVARIAAQRAALRRFAETEDGEIVLEADSRALTVEEEIALGRTRFEDATLAVSGLEVVGKNKLAVDLSKNDLLYEEREALLRYLRRGEGLNVGRVDEAWFPHATVFDGYDHISSQSQTVSYAHGSLPTEMVYFAPEVVFGCDGA